MSIRIGKQVVGRDYASNINDDIISKENTYSSNKTDELLTQVKDLINSNGTITNESLEELQTKLNTLSKTDVGLDLIDNTADVNKPVSEKTQIELNKKADVVHTHKIKEVDNLRFDLYTNTQLSVGKYTRVIESELVNKANTGVYAKYNVELDYTSYFDLELYINQEKLLTEEMPNVELYVSNIPSYVHAYATIQADPDWQIWDVDVHLKIDKTFKKLKLRQLNLNVNSDVLRVSSAYKVQDTLNTDKYVKIIEAVDIGKEKLDKKVDKVDGQGLSSNDYTDTEKEKLNGIAKNANNYTHPTTAGNKHIPSGGASGQILRWSADGTASWGTDNNTTYNTATTSADGLMSKTDKSKVDGIAAGANKYVHPNDANTRHVTDAEKAAWNEKANASHKHNKSQITDMPTSLPANGGNADTVDGLHSHQIGTLSASGTSHGIGYTVVCRHNVDGDNRFKFVQQESDHELSVHYANKSGNADTLDGKHATNFANVNNATFTGTFSLGRVGVLGTNSIAMGINVESSGSNSIAMGKDAKASGANSIAMGINAKALARNSTSIGNGATASGIGESVAIGNGTTASGVSAVAIGRFTKVTGSSGCALNNSTTATQNNLAIGKYNRIPNNLYDNSKDGDVFVIGNGLYGGESNAFRVTAAGATYTAASYNSFGADYAEYFEWADGNLNNEDRVGHFVTLDGIKIKYANSSDYVLGIVSGNPCIIGNSDEDWIGRWQHDEFDRFLTREAITPITELRENKKEDGTIELIEVETGETIIGFDYIPNKDYNPDEKYIERKDRKEWSAIGMVGVLNVWDDGTCQVNGYCTVADGGIATSTESELSGYRVMERVTDNIIKVIFR